MEHFDQKIKANNASIDNETLVLKNKIEDMLNTGEQMNFGLSNSLRDSIN